MRKLTSMLFASALALSVSGIALAQDNPMVGGAPMYAEKNIVENAVNSKDHTTLVAAVKAAGLVETLQGPGPFTVLAPVNAAFDALPPGTVATLLKPENKDQLVKILTCHVIPAKAMSTDIMQMVKDDGGMHKVKTVGGCELTLKSEGGKVTVTDENGNVANVTIADVRQSNGVIHVIDKVLLPKMDAAQGDTAKPADNAMTASDNMATGDNPMVGGAPMYAEKNIVENAVNSKDHTTLVAAVKAAGLVDTLTGPGPFTVLAPVNAAFDSLPAGTVDTLLKPENKDQLVKTLACHVIPAKAMSSDIMQMVTDDGGMHKVKTVGGCELTLKSEGGKVTVTDENGNVANVTIADVRQSNGVIHVIDKVLLPKMDAAEADTAMAASGDDNMAMGDNPMVGSAPMYAEKNIVENAVNSKDHTTLVAAVKAAGLVDTLTSSGPFTVFAPTNEAFDMLPAGTVETLLKPENKDKLTKVLTAHVVAGKLSGADLMKMAKAHGGRYDMNAVSGDALTALVKGKNLYIIDEHGTAAKVTIADVNQSNGVIHVVNKVLVPR